MDLICRTCLRMNELQFNVFEHFQNNKSISELIMECTPIKVDIDDGLPINICGNCLERLNSAFEFITMVVQSDMKLKKFSRTGEVNKGCQSDMGDKEEMTVIENEQMELISCRENDSLISSNSNAYSMTMGDYLQNNGDKLDYQNVCFKKEGIFSSNDFENEGVQEVIENKEIKPGQPYENKLLEEVKQEQEHSLIKVEEENSEDIFQDDKIIEFDQQLLNYKMEVNTNNETVIKPRVYRLVNRNRCVNERQAELLDNPDYKRISQMKLDPKEKARQPVYCRECNKTFTFQYFTGIHAHIHTGNLPFKCDKCDARFPKKPLLNQHLGTHVETKEFSCGDCGKTFATIYLLRTHRIMHTDKAHKCSICGKAYKFSFLLRRHVKVHNNERDHMCEVCGKTFVAKSCLGKHRMIHFVSDDKRFECNVCNKKFQLKTSLTTHKKVHSTRKPFVCNHCGKSFQYSKILKHHLFIHTGEKPYACKVCDKTFRQKSSIPRHMRMHTGETPYSCELCSSTFKYKHRFLEHMKTHEEEPNKTE